MKVISHVHHAEDTMDPDYMQGAAKKYDCLNCCNNKTKSVMLIKHVYANSAISNVNFGKNSRTLLCLTRYIF